MCHPEVPAGTPLPDVATRDVTVPVAGASMPALLALPQRTPAPAILVINDVFGQSPFYDHVTRRLAQTGFVVLDPEFFHRLPPLESPTREAAMARRQKHDGKLMLEDLNAAVDHLKGMPEVRADRIGLIGFCMGGTAVLQLAATRDDVRAPVAYYGFPVAGKPGPVPAPIDLAAKTHGPVLGHWGDQDTGVGMDNLEAYRKKLEAAGVAHTFHVYPGLGHGFLKAFLDDETTPGYEQACTSWKRTLDFYRSRLS